MWRQDRASDPQRHGIGRVVQEGGVGVDLFPIGGIDLQVPQQVSDDVAAQEHAGHGHDRLLADGGLVEAHSPIDRLNRKCTHAEILDEAKWLRPDRVVTPRCRGTHSGSESLKFQYSGFRQLGSVEVL